MARRNPRAAAWEWADVIQFLISAGHARDSIDHYTYAQVRAFLDAIDRARARRRAERLVDMRAAGATMKDFENYLKRMEQ